MTTSAIEDTPARVEEEGRGVDGVEIGSADEALGTPVLVTAIVLLVETAVLETVALDLVTLAVALVVTSNTATGSINHCISLTRISVLPTAHPPLGIRHCFNAARQNPRVDGRYSHFWPRLIARHGERMRTEESMIRSFVRQRVELGAVE